jgi:hypothetical protein
MERHAMRRAKQKIVFLCLIFFAAIGFAAQTKDLPFGEWKRASGEPIISPQGPGLESAGTCNPAVTFVQVKDSSGKTKEKIVMLYAAQMLHKSAHDVARRRKGKGGS